MALSLLPAMVKDHIGGTEGVVTLGLTTFVIGIAIGSGLAARASHGKPNLALVPLGAVLMGVFALDPWRIGRCDVAGRRAGRSGGRAARSGTGLAVVAALCGLAIAGGLYIVPAFAAVQAWSPPERRARVIAAVNIMNAAYMVGGGAIVAGLQAAGVGVGAIFTALGLLSIAAVAYVVHAWGSNLIRDLGRLIFGFFFHLEVKGLEHLDGGRRARRHRAQPCEPARRSAAAHDPAPGGIVRGQLADRHGVVGEAVPQSDQCVSAGAQRARWRRARSSTLSRAARRS